MLLNFNKDVFIPVFTKELHDEVCRNEYPYCVATSYADIITFSTTYALVENL
jgi:predicted ATPase